MVYYEAQQPHERLPYRILKVSHTVNVIGSVIVGHTVYGVPARLDQRVLRVSVANAHPQGRSIKLQSIVYDASCWSAELVRGEIDVNAAIEPAIGGGGGAYGQLQQTTIALGETIMLVYLLTRKAEVTPGERGVLPLATACPATECYVKGVDQGALAGGSGDSSLAFQLIWDMIASGDADAGPASGTRGYNTSVASMSPASPGRPAGGGITSTFR
jgi:hypothetical protein